MERPGVLIVTEHASARFGGEAALALHYFRVLRRRGVPVWLITHERTRAELLQAFPGEARMVFVRDTWFHKLMWRIGRRLPDQISAFSTGFAQRLSAQLQQRRLVRQLLAREAIGVIHQPMPVSPKEPSMLYGFGVPVIIGPMNGGMEYPPGLSFQRGMVERWFFQFGRWSSALLNWLMPGKRQAAVLLVANERTRASLPRGSCRDVRLLVENGVDLSLWSTAVAAVPAPQGLPTFVFMGRLVGWKAVDLLLQAFQRANGRHPMRLLIVGDGTERKRLERLAGTLGVLAATQDAAGVRFTGWLPQQDCAEVLRNADGLVLPSLYECGGAVVLEAMSMGKPVIATAWGGPVDYLDEQCGVLVPPASRESLVQGFEDAMVDLASSPDKRARMGAAGRRKVREEYDWEVKVERMIGIYREVSAA